jgi:hypothetical protein
VTTATPTITVARPRLAAPSAERELTEELV